MALDRPYPTPDHLSGKALEARKAKIKQEHDTYHNHWEHSTGHTKDGQVKSMKQIFDAGRLRSPMWQAYRHEYKGRAHRNQKVPWTSKWDNPADFGATVKEFLHLTAEQNDADGMLAKRDPPKMATPNETISDRGVTPAATYSTLKRFMAKVKHGTKHANVDKNMVLLPCSFTTAADRKDYQRMDEMWKKIAKYRKRPEDYNRIFILSAYKDDKYCHSYLTVVDFTGRNEQPPTCRIETIDSGHHGFDETFRQLWIWLCGTLRDGTGWRCQHIIRHVQPVQHDGWNCTQYTTEFAKNLMRGRDISRTGGLKHLDIPADEPTWRMNPEQLYRRGRKENGVAMHPRLDEVVEHFAKKRIKRRDQLTVWQIEQMRGFR
jgi:hypothetical protein